MSQGQRDHSESFKARVDLEALEVAIALYQRWHADPNSE